MKRNLRCIILSLALVALIAACGTTPPPSSTVTASRPAPSSTVSQAPAILQNEHYSEESLFIPHDTHDIPATLVLPIAGYDEKVPLVLLLHGTGADQYSLGAFPLLAEKLAKAGIASLRIDFIGTGQSEADYKDYSFSSAIADAETAMAFVATREEIDAERIGIMGWSQGGSIALLTAARNPQYKSAVTWAAPIDFSSFLTDEMRTLAQEQGCVPIAFEWRTPLNLGLQWVEEADSIDFKSEIKNINGPVLALQGADDDIIPSESAKNIRLACSNKNSEYEILKNMNHLFNVNSGDLTDIETICDRTVFWFGKTL